MTLCATVEDIELVHAEIFSLLSCPEDGATVRRNKSPSLHVRAAGGFTGFVCKKQPTASGISRKD